MTRLVEKLPTESFGDIRIMRYNKYMITRKTLNELHELTAKVTELKDIASENLKTAQDRFNHRTHKIMREGKEIELTEKVLWDEVFLIGPGGESGQFMKTIHPQVFDLYKKQEEAAEELKKFAIVELGMNMQALTLSDYLKATEGLFALMFEEKMSEHEQALFEAGSKAQ